MAEISLIVNVITLVDFSCKVLKRLDEYNSATKDIPGSIRQIHAQLPLLRECLEDTQEGISAGVIKKRAQEALVPALEGCRSQIDALNKLLEKTLPAEGDSTFERNRKALRSLRYDEQLNKIWQSLNSHVQTLTFYHASTSSVRADETLRNIQNWLSAPDPSTNLNKALKQHQPGTGKWFLESENFLRWKEEPMSTLWLHGIPGCGKTVLSSTIIDSLKKDYAEDPGRVVVYFYFRFDDSMTQRSQYLVSSLVSQLSDYCTAIPQPLYRLYESCGSGSKQPNSAALIAVLKQLLRQFPHVFVVLDALDECVDRDEMLELVEQMIGWKQENVHILLTSRREREIEMCLEGFLDRPRMIGLQSSVVNPDIRAYIAERLTSDRKLRAFGKDPSTREAIEGKLSQEAGGMFVKNRVVFNPVSIVPLSITILSVVSSILWILLASSKLLYHEI